MPSLSRYRSKPLWWWFSTPLYALNHLKAFLGKAAVARGAEGGIDVLVFNEFFRTQREGVFIEVGAARPDLLSIGALFRKRGWRVIAIEPNPVFCEMHRAKGNEILQYACGTHDEDDVEFSVVHSHSGDQISNESYSSLSIKEGYAALEENVQDLDIEKIRVKLRRLDSIMEAHAPEVKHVDCLSIDVEGWELEVLEGFNLAKFRPRIMIIENLLDDDNYRTYMTKHGYSLWKTVHPNEVYVRAS